MTFHTADLSDAHPDALYVLGGQWHWLGARRSFHGPISTLEAKGFNGEIREALSEQGEGRVLVIDAGDCPTALIGENLARLAQNNGWAGLVINGNVRDAAALAALDVAILARGTWPVRSLNQRGGSREVPLCIATVTVEPQQWLYADEDGVLLSESALHV